jgi:hypothetical protein
MKLTISIICSIIIAASTAANAVEKSNIVTLQGQSKNAIYQKAIQFVTYKFVSGKAVIDYQDPSIGRIIAKGNLYLGNIIVNKGYVSLIITIDCINGKSKISIQQTGCMFNIYPQECTGSGMGGLEKKIPGTIDKLINDYSEYMTSSEEAAAWDGK